MIYVVSEYRKVWVIFPYFIRKLSSVAGYTLVSHLCSLQFELEVQLYVRKLVVDYLCSEVKSVQS